MKRYCSLLFVLVLLLTGCAVKNGGVPTEQQVEARRDQLAEMSRSKTVTVVEHPYLGAKPVLRAPEEVPVLGTIVTLKQKGTLSELCTTLSALAPVSAHVADPMEVSEGSPSAPQSQPQSPVASGNLELPPLEDPFLLSPLGKGVLSVSYTGPLRGLLDTLASLSGYGWDYDSKTNRVSFSSMQVRTYTLMAAPGAVTYESQLSNKSREQRSGGLSGSGINSTVTSGDTSAQTAQVNKTKFDFDIWHEVEAGIKALLSTRGTVSSNQAAGTVTVRDSYTRLRDVEAYIEAMNLRLSRQVAVTVRVWALEISDSSAAGLNLQALFENSDLSVVAGSLTDLGSTASAAISVVSGKLKGSRGTLKALREWGKATQLTSAGGLLMSNQPLPVLAIKRHSYLAGMSLSTNDYNQTSEITPGEVTTGFAMTLVPHILKDRRVILQYNITLSALDSMEEIDKGEVYVQLPQVSTRSFAQRSRMKMGQTLVLAGFEQNRQTANNAFGILNTGRDAEYGKTLLIITIELESVEF